MIMQLLAGANLIDVDFGPKEDRTLFRGAQKREFHFVLFRILALRRIHLWCYMSGRCSLSCAHIMRLLNVLNPN